MNCLADTAKLFDDGDWIESKDQDPNGEVRLIQLADIGIGRFLDRSSRYLSRATAQRLRCTFLKPGDILIARMPDPIGRACIFPDLNQDCVTAVDVSILRTNDAVDCEFLMYQINSPSFLNSALSQAKGATRQRISRVNLGKLPVAIPVMTKQRRIVAQIKELLGRVDEANRLQAETRVEVSQLMPALLNEVWTNDRITAAESIPLGQLGEITTGNTPSRKIPEYFGGNQPWITPGDFNGRIIESAREYISERGIREARARVVTSGSILVVCIGATIGKTALAGVDLGINQQINAVTFDPKRVLPEYGYWACKALSPHIIRNASKATLPILNKGQFSKLSIPVPRLDVQQAVADRLNEADDAIREINQTRSEIETAIPALRDAILRKAFVG